MNLDDLAYARCKACNTRFYPAEERGEFEDMCNACIKHVNMVEYYGICMDQNDSEYLDTLFGKEEKHE
jgi:hypothetical protein